MPEPSSRLTAVPVFRRNCVPGPNATVRVSPVPVRRSASQPLFRAPRSAAQGGLAHGRRDAVEHARQPAGALPGAFVLGMAGAPVVAGLDFVGAGLAGAQPHEPAGGLARHPALDRRVVAGRIQGASRMHCS
ncbi:hypothetical protein NB2BOR_A02220 [Bordetella parapertussis]|nr:hypothetical protein NB2BOR_A02220 [Bordetella parapertussis]